MERFGTIALEFLRRIHPVERANSGRAGFILQPDLFLHNPIAKKISQFERLLAPLFGERKTPTYHGHGYTPRPWPFPLPTAAMPTADRRRMMPMHEQGIIRRRYALGDGHRRR